jgi:hypothetical protein
VCTVDLTSISSSCVELLAICPFHLAVCEWTEGSAARKHVSSMRNAHGVF